LGPWQPKTRKNPVDFHLTVSRLMALGLGFSFVPEWKMSIFGDLALIAKFHSLPSSFDHDVTCLC
jgi:hypothetical protein